MRNAAAISVILMLAGCASRPAVSWNDANQVRAALDAGADVEAPDRNGWTRLLVATRLGHADVVRVLVEHGADVQARNRDGWSALLIASRYGYPEIVRFLLDHGAYVHTKNHAGYTPMMLAAAGGHDEIIRTLVDAGVRLDARNDEGKAAVYYAALNIRTGTVRFLLDRGLEVQLFENGGEELFATAVAFEVRGGMHAERGNASAATIDNGSAADYFERAQAGLNGLADSYHRKQTAVLALSLLGLVATYADVANMSSRNPMSGSPTFFSDLVPDVNPATMTAAQIGEAYYRGLSRYAAAHAVECRGRAGGGS